MDDYYLELDIEALRKATALKIAKQQMDAYEQLQKELYAIIDDIIETIKKEIIKNGQEHKTTLETTKDSDKR